ncbi:hypothetical protein [Nostoc sp.]|uniref:hypothetical protein n=1 Tax=Nostoc sp. TaxID=1180 RepID=UPI003FA52B36
MQTLSLFIGKRQFQNTLNSTAPQPTGNRLLPPARRNTRGLALSVGTLVLSEAEVASLRVAMPLANEKRVADKPLECKCVLHRREGFTLHYLPPAFLDKF